MASGQTRGAPRNESPVGARDMRVRHARQKLPSEREFAWPRNRSRTLPERRGAPAAGRHFTQQVAGVTATHAATTTNNGDERTGERDEEHVATGRDGGNGAGDQDRKS